MRGGSVVVGLALKRPDLSVGSASSKRHFLDGESVSAGCSCVVGRGEVVDLAVRYCDKISIPELAKVRLYLLTMWKPCVHPVVSTPLPQLRNKGLHLLKPLEVPTPVTFITFSACAASSCASGMALTRYSN